VDLSGAGIAGVTQRDEKHFSTAGKPELVLSTFDGSIEVRAWDRPEVSVVIEKRAPNESMASSIEVISQQDGDRIAVEVKHHGPWGWAWFGPGSASLIVSVPQAADVRASSGDGAITLEHVSGTIALRSGDGRIRASGASGRVSAATGDGSIDLDGIDGAVEATTGDGRVRVEGKLSAVKARSGDGSMTIQASPGSAPQSDWEITSGDGSVTLRLPDGFNANLDARTGDGGIRLDGVSVTSSGTMARNAINGQLGSGGHAVRVRTGDGSITLRGF
jgi:hypothetical protein